MLSEKEKLENEFAKLYYDEQFTPQEKANRICELFYEDAMKKFNTGLINRQLNKCQAWVYENDEYYYLRSYNTLVAIIYKECDILIDVLRGVYGYTATSSKHISKFEHKYGRLNYGCSYRFTYR